MSLNWREIDLVLEELDLSGSFVQQIVQPDFRNLMLRIYRPGDPLWLRICLETGKTRLHRDQRPAKNTKKQRFVQLLLARVKGGRIESASQIGRDRIVRLSLGAGEAQTFLWIRLWGGASNIIATDENRRILDAFFRRPKRGEVSGEVFELPEPRETDREEETFDSRFAPPETAEQPTVSAQIALHYARLTDAREEETLRDRLAKKTDSRFGRVERQLETARSRLDEADNADRLQLLGDLIRSHAHRIHGGDRWLEAEDYTNNGARLSIELDADLSPIENAERYYTKARRAKRKRESLADEVRNLEGRLDSLGLQREAIETADLEELRRLDDTGEEHKQGRIEAEPTPPGLRFQSGPFVILVGRNSRENDELLRHHVKGNDLWLHTRDVPGGYVFVRAQKQKSVPLDVLLDAGNLAVHFSKARPSGKAELYYTQVKYLRRARGGPKGLVLPTHEKNLSIAVDSDRIARLRA